MLDNVSERELTAKERILSNAIGRKALFVLEKELGGQSVWIPSGYNEIIANLIGVDKAKQVSAVYRCKVINIPRRFFRQVRNKKIIDFIERGYSPDDVARTLGVPVQIVERIYRESKKNNER